MQNSETVRDKGQSFVTARGKGIDLQAPALQSQSGGDE